MEVTLLFTSVLSVFMIVLAVRVLDLRGSPVTKSFHKPDRQIDPKDLERAIRGHGNLIEYAPLFLILMLALELSDASKTLLYAWGIICTLGRLMHGIAFSFMKKWILKDWRHVINFCWFSWINCSSLRDYIF